MSIFRPMLYTAAVAGALASSQLHADAIGLKVGVINGVAIEYHKAFSPKLNARIALTTLPLEADFEQDDIEYEAEIDKNNIGILMDWHPFSGSFRITGGLYVGEHEWNLTAKANDGEYEIGDNTYQSSDLSLKGTIAFNESTPYLGIGFGNTIGTSGLAMSFDLGVLAVGEGSVSYEASGTVSSGGLNLDVGSDPAFQADLEKERKQLEEDLEDFTLMPVISFGVVYEF